MITQSAGMNRFCACSNVPQRRKAVWFGSSSRRGRNTRIEEPASPHPIRSRGHHRYGRHERFFESGCTQVAHPWQWRTTQAPCLGTAPRTSATGRPGCLVNRTPLRAATAESEFRVRQISPRRDSPQAAALGQQTLPVGPWREVSRTPRRRRVGNQADRGNLLAVHLGNQPPQCCGLTIR